MSNPYLVIAAVMDDRQIIETLSDMLGIDGCWSDIYGAVSMRDSYDVFTPLQFTSDAILSLQYVLPDYEHMWETHVVDIPLVGTVTLTVTDSGHYTDESLDLLSRSLVAHCLMKGAHV